MSSRAVALPTLAVLRCSDTGAIITRGTLRYTLLLLYGVFSMCLGAFNAGRYHVFVPGAPLQTRVSGIIITFWNAANGDVTSGVHFEVVVLDSVLNYGQGFITLLLFGLSGAVGAHLVTDVRVSCELGAGTYAMPARIMRAAMARLRGALVTDITSSETGCALHAARCALSRRQLRCSKLANSPAALSFGRRA